VPLKTSLARAALLNTGLVQRKQRSDGVWYGRGMPVDAVRGMAQLGEERQFSGLLTGVLSPRLRDSIYACAPVSVLDVGSFSGETLCMMHHWFPFITHLEGWEAVSAEKVLAALRKADSVRWPHARYRTLYERYCMHVNELGKPGWTRIANEPEYKKIINVRFETDPSTTRPLLRSYDMLIISNVLHTLSHTSLDVLIDKLEGLKHPGTLTYIHVKSRPAEGFMPGMTHQRIMRACDALAAQWDLRAIIGPLDHEGQHTTFTDL
jgi:hypothetical protein